LAATVALYGFLKRLLGHESQRPAVEFVVFDLETTGLQPKKHHIIEIGAIHYTDGQTNHRTFQAFIDAGVPVPKKITSITGITDEMLRGQDAPKQALREFHDFVGGRALVAYNAEFDMGFLRHHGARFGLEFDHPVIDVLPLARSTWPNLPNHRLGTVAKYLDIEATPTHRALDDCLTTLHVYARSTLSQ
jgi:DNA polymerase III epsilon subunit family exonuclease